MKATIKLALLGTLVLSGGVLADVNVFSCEPEWAALAREIGGDEVETFSATTPFQDPHFIQARPSLIARVRRADLVICTGANLEIGWLPVLLRQAGNASVNPGSDGFIDASQSVRLLDVPGAADRASGDIHPYGNPHFQTDARNIPLVGATVLERLEIVDAANADYYRMRFDDFERRWRQALQRWEEARADLDGMEIVVQHAAWVYMESWLGLEEVGQLEPKPGLPPTPSHMATLLRRIESRPVKVIVRAAYQTPRASDWLTKRADIPSIVIPHTVGATDKADDLFGMFDEMIRLLRDANR